MTTVAYKNGVLAFDSKVSSSGVHVGWMVKGRKTSKYLIAGCGACEDLQAFIDWMVSGGAQEDKKKYGLDREVDLAAIVINKKGKVLHYESRLYPYEINSELHAVGSGADIAIGAMAFGATSSQAVKIASKFDVATGGTIKDLSWNKG